MNVKGFLTEVRRLVEQLRTHGLRLTFLAGWDKLVRALNRTPLRRFTQITPQVILGGQPSSITIPTLVRERNVTGFINMRSEYDYAQKVDTGKVRYLRLPTPDNEAPSIDNLCKGVDFIRDELAKGGSVYIHCWEGLGRGPTMAAAYLVSTGSSPEESWRKIRQVRPFIRPTKVQLDRLMEFAAQYGQPGAVEQTPPKVAIDPQSPPPEVLNAERQAQAQPQTSS